MGELDKKIRNYSSMRLILLHHLSYIFMFEALDNRMFKSTYCSSIQMKWSRCGGNTEERRPSPTKRPVREGFTEEVTSELSFARGEGVSETKSYGTSIASKWHVQRIRYRSTKQHGLLREM